MPELPEVEVTRLGIAPYVEGQRIGSVVLRDGRLRQPVNADLDARLTGQTIQRLLRRGKYLLADLDQGQLLLHLGMSGHLRVLPAATPVRKHDHLDLVLNAGDLVLRYHDPRRFGLVLWAPDFQNHPLLCHLGPEPLEEGFHGAYLYARSRGHRLAVKAFLMDSRVVVGVGNIYANEALFAAGIDPRRAAGSISQTRYTRLALAVRTVLASAIAQGGTTLRDFTQPDGATGYFRLKLQVYGKESLPCPRCARPLQGERIGGRMTVFCVHCQR